MQAAPSLRAAAPRAAPASLPEMLPAANRMRRPDEFAKAFDGKRARAGRVAVYLGSADAPDAADLHEVKVGFVVSKKVGNSVVRHRISRQLRHILRPWINDGTLARGEYVVVRALPGSAGSSSADFAADMSAALKKIRRKQHQRGTSTRTEA